MEFNSEEIMPVFLIAFVWAAFLSIIGFTLYSFIKHYFETLFGLEVFLKPVNKAEWLAILEKEFSFYNKLPPKSKKLFLKKLSYFYHGKNFIPKSGIVLDERKKILICASAAQLTFGLPLLKLPHFKDILIYPSSYYNKRTKKNHVGEVNTQGVIVFSWEHIQKGFDNQEDGYNVALHELAHALRFEDYYPNEERHFLKQEDVNQLQRIYDDVKGLAQTQLPTFLNKYAFSNLEEFFAVSVESFFERPVAFKKNMPDLYACMSNLLNQDTFLLEEMNKK